MARNSTPPTSASIMRLTALTPAPPTPTTRSCGAPIGSATPNALGDDDHSSWGGAIMLSGMSEENAWRRRSWGVGARRTGSGRGAGGGSSAAGGGAGGAAGSGVASARGGAAGGSPSVSVLRNRAASGPSRMLARLPLAILEHLLRQLAIGVGRRAAGVVPQHRHALH